MSKPLETDPQTQRTLILDWYHNLLETRYGSQSGNAWFRKTRHGVWLPNENVKPSMVVMDTGQRKARDGDDAETSKELLLSWDIVLNLKDVFGKDKVFVEWVDRVQQIIVYIQNKCAPQLLVSNDYQDDEPIQTVLADGAVVEAWRIGFESRYAAEVGELV